MKIKNKKQLEVLWMEGSRRDTRKTFEKKPKKTIFQRSCGWRVQPRVSENRFYYYYYYVDFVLVVDFILWTMKEESCEDGQVLGTN